MAAVLACALVASLGATESAGALVNSSPPSASMRLEGSNGYPIDLQVSDGFSTIAVSEPGERGINGATSEYVVFGGRAGVDEAEADFGRFGKVAVRFVPSGKVKRWPMPEACEGKPKFIRYGAFVGTIRFRGETGYTEVDVHRARGTVRATPRQVCHPRNDRPAEKSQRRTQDRQLLVTTFTAFHISAGVGVSAVRSEADPTAALLVANSSESVGRVWISRLAFVEASKDVFSFDPSLNTATLAPPRPFSGSATFQQIDDYTTRWEGSLTVSFPGRPDVSLTGRGFAATLDSAKRDPSTSTAFGTSFNLLR